MDLAFLSKLIRNIDNHRKNEGINMIYEVKYLDYYLKHNLLIKRKNILNIIK